MAFKILNSAELAVLNSVELELYQRELMEHQPFDLKEWHKKNPHTVDKSVKPAFPPTLVDPDDEECKAYIMMGITVEESKHLSGIRSNDIIDLVRKDIQADERFAYCAVGRLTPPEEMIYQAAASGVEGWRDYIRPFHSLKESEIGLRILDITSFNNGIKLEVIPHGAKAEFMEELLSNKKNSIRLYPRIGRNPDMSVVFLGFDVDLDYPMP